jgi:hypothetical protein
MMLERAEVMKIWQTKAKRLAFPESERMTMRWA